MVLSCFGSEQKVAALGTVRPIPDSAKPFLVALLGEGYEEVGAVCQYVASRKNNTFLREVRLWILTHENRGIERAVVLGVYDLDRFNIYASDGIDGNRPALGVVSAGAKNFPNVME